MTDLSLRLILSYFRPFLRNAMHTQKKVMILDMRAPLRCGWQVLYPTLVWVWVWYSFSRRSTEEVYQFIEVADSACHLIVPRDGRVVQDITRIGDVGRISCWRANNNWRHPEIPRIRGEITLSPHTLSRRRRTSRIVILYQYLVSHPRC